MKRTTHHGQFFLQPTDAVLSHNSPKAASKRPKKIFRCTVFCVCFSAASCKRRLRKVFTWKFFWPFLFCKDFSIYGSGHWSHNFFLYECPQQVQCFLTRYVPSLERNEHFATDCCPLLLVWVIIHCVALLNEGPGASVSAARLSLTAAT